MPVVTSSPARAPASRPTLSGSDVLTATSSKRSSEMSCRSVSRPALPVASCATRVVMSVSFLEPVLVAGAILPRMGRVEGKVALISGGARNIGGASARLLVSEGARVVIGDLLDEEGQALADELGDSARYVHLDVTSEEDWAAAVALTVAEFGKLDVLFNNAGIFNGGQLQRYKAAQWQQMLDVNLTGAFFGAKAAADALIAAGGGSIINTSSI